MNDALVDYGKQIRNVVSAIIGTADVYAEKNPSIKKVIDYILKFTEEKLNQTQPEIMIYGIYNAGKSSIINELVGSDVAEVNDIPTTDKVQYYNVNGYRVADTPGVGAPIEHEEVTNAHLKNADVVLFVMSSTGSHDKRQNYERIRDIFNSEKKVIIILNDKNGDLDNNNRGDDGLTGNERISLIKSKIGENLRNVGLENSQFHIICVNAKRAKLGRIKNSPQMLEKSNMAELIQVVTQEVKKSNSGRSLRTLAAQLVTESQKIINYLGAVIETSASEKHINNFLSIIREQVSCLRSDMNSLIERRLSELSVRLPDMLWQNRENPQASENYMREAVSAQMRVIKEGFLARLRELDGILKDNAEQFNMNQESCTGNVPAEIGTCSPDSFRELLEVIEKGLKESASMENSESDNPNVQAEKSNLTKPLLTAGATYVALKPLLVSLGVNPIVGVAVALLGAFSFFGSSDDKEREHARAFRENQMARLEAEKQAQAELRTKCQYLCNDLIDKTKLSVGGILDEVNRNLVAPYKELAYKMREENGKLVDDVENIKSAMDALNLIRENLKSE